MSRTLFERLKKPGAARPAGDVGRQGKRPELRDESFRSVLHNLERVLNSRQDIAPACLDYGLMDLAQIVYNLPEAEGAAERAVQKCIETFEPRLSRVRVKRVEDASRPLVLCFSVTASLESGSERVDLAFDTEVACTGGVRLSPR